MGPRAQLELEKVHFYFPLHGRLSLGANTAVFPRVVMSGRFHPLSYFYSAVMVLRIKLKEIRRKMQARKSIS